MTQAPTGAFAVRMTRLIPGPVEAVYAAFLDPDVLRRWYAPINGEVADADVDPRVGGRHHTIVVDVDGGRHENTCEIRELVPAEKIVMSWLYQGPHAPADDSESLLTVEFRGVGARSTELTLTHERLATTEGRDTVRDGWSALLDRLVEEMISGD